MLSDKKNYNSIDLFKWITAILIIYMHVEAFYNTEPYCFFNSQIHEIIFRSAVPVFFIISGFLLAVSGDFLVKIKVYMIKILRLYCIWTLIYMPVTLYSYFTDEYSAYENMLIFLRGFLFMGEQRYSWHLWYLLSLFFALLFIYFIFKAGFSNKALFIGAILIFIFMQIFDFYKTENLLYQAFDTGRIFMGAVYVPFGVLIAKHSNKINPTAVIIGLTAGISVILLSKNQLILNFCFLINSIMLFLLILKIKLPDSIWWYSLRKASSVMYFTHMLFILAFNSTSMPYFVLIAVFISTQILSIIILKTENNHKWLKKIF